MATDTRRVCLALDLKDDAALIEKYKQHHAKGQIWPEVEAQIRSMGIADMQIYCTGNRLFMIMEIDESFDPDSMKSGTTTEPKVKEWEDLMATFQQRLPWAEADELWVTMDRIFKLGE